MLASVQGYYDGSQIILNQDFPLMNGQQVILTALDAATDTLSVEVSAYKIRQASTQEKEWQSFMEGINGFTEDFMKDGREAEIPSARESL